MKVFIEKVKNEKGEFKGNLYLESDSMQFMIKEYSGKVSKDKETGKETEVYNILGYFSNIKSACNFLLKTKLMQSNAGTLKELLEEMKRLNEWVDALFKLEVING